VPEHLILFAQVDPEDETLIYPLHNGIEVRGVAVDEQASVRDKLKMLHKKASKLVVYNLLRFTHIFVCPQDLTCLNKSIVNFVT